MLVISIRIFLVNLIRNLVDLIRILDCSFFISEFHLIQPNIFLFVYFNK